MDSIIAELTGAQALQVLRRLVAKHNDVSQAVIAEARLVLAAVDLHAVAQHICLMLATPDFDDLNHRSGRTRYGYVDPVDAMYDIFTEQLDPFKDQLHTYRSLSMREEETAYLQGIILGLYTFEEKPQGELADWYTDMPFDTADELFQEWKTHRGLTEADTEMKDFLYASCPRWADALCGPPVSIND